MFKYFSGDSLGLDNIMLKTDLLPYKKRSEVVIWARWAYLVWNTPYHYGVWTSSIIYFHLCFEMVHPYALTIEIRRQEMVHPYALTIENRRQEMVHPYALTIKNRCKKDKEINIRLTMFLVTKTNIYCILFQLTAVTCHRSQCKLITSWHSQSV